MFCLSRVIAEKGLGENGIPVLRRIRGNEKAIQQTPTAKPEDAPGERKELLFWVSSTYYMEVFWTTNFNLKWI